MTPAPKEDFEALLDKAIEDIKTTLVVGQSLSNADFEEAAFKALERAAKGTPFENEIKHTSDSAFPDIQIQKSYGVEVKKTTTDKLAVRGNSIFENSRVPGVKDIYVIMGYNTNKNPEVEWRKYEEAIGDIVVTHSPRYKIDFSLKQGQSFFEKIGVPYDKFRLLSQEEKMQHVRNSYTEQGKKDLWWLIQQDVPINYRYFTDLTQEERKQFMGEVFFLCPQVFGEGNDKFSAVGIYALAKGIIYHSWRDQFSSGGSLLIGKFKYPQIVKRAKLHLPYIQEAAENLDDSLLEQFWGATPPPEEGRFELWLDKVKRKYKKEGDILEALKISTATHRGR